MASSRYSRYDTNSDALAAVSKKKSNIGSIVKKFMGSGSGNRTVLAVPEEIKKKTAAPPPKGSNLPAVLHRKLFSRSGGSADGKVKALTEVKANTRTLAMVLRSERELLSQNEEYEDDIAELKMLIEEKDRQVDKLKDLCLKQREEIKALKDAILFPDVMNSQLHDLLEKQGSELKQARQIIPSLQKQVVSLSGQLQCIVDDLAEVKADKYATRTCFDGVVSSPQTPKYCKEAPNSLEYSCGGGTVYGSPDDMFVKDLNPCLTPRFTKSKAKEYDEISGYDSLNKDMPFHNSSSDRSQENVCVSFGGRVAKSSESRKTVWTRLQQS